MAWAPKLMRRVYGVVGAVRADARSSSSTAFSSIRSELLVEILPLRMPLNGAPFVGDVPDRPSVVMERRRRGSPMEEAFMGPGNAGVPVEAEPLRWNRPVKAPEVTEPRRWRGMSEGLLELSPDIVK